MIKTMGMWLFIASEILIFGALLYLYEIHAHEQREVFAASSLGLHFIHGTINTAILLTSSYLVALKRTNLAAALGLIFLAIKGHEYFDLIVNEGKFLSTNMFYTFYFFITGLHGVHVIFGIIALLLLKKFRDWEENVGLYWHFVDLVWVFVYPLFYLLGK